MVIEMYINNKLRDLAYKTSLVHGFWDNMRTYDDFVVNLTAEFQEVKEEGILLKYISKMGINLKERLLN